MIVILSISSAIAVSSVLLSMVIARLFMRPLKNLVMKAADIEDMKLEQVEESLKNNLSMFLEIRSLQCAFFSLTRRLKELRSFIPDHILMMLDQRNGAVQEEGLVVGDETDTSTTEIVTPNDTSSSHGEGLHTRAKSYYRGLVQETFSLGLHQGSATVLTLKIFNMKKLISVMEPQELSSIVSGITSSVIDASRVGNGQIVKNSPDKVVIAWNTTKKQQNHVVQATTTMVKLSRRLEDLRSDWSEDKVRSSINIRLAVATGHAIYGNFGTEKVKYFTVLGDPVDVSTSLCHMAEMWNVRTVCCNSTVAHLRNRFLVRPIDEVFVNEASILGYEVNRELANRVSNEWMYEMEEVRIARLWNHTTEAFQEYQKGKKQTAVDLLSSYSGDDPVCFKLMDTYQNEIDKFIHHKGMTVTEKVTRRKYS